VLGARRPVTWLGGMAGKRLGQHAADAECTAHIQSPHRNDRLKPAFVNSRAEWHAPLFVEIVRHDRMNQIRFPSEILDFGFRRALYGSISLV
jgi:hypothetical protein